MKITCISLLAIILTFTACDSNTEKEANNKSEITSEMIETPQTANETATSEEKMPKISFAKDTYEFGTITQGEKVGYSFKFTNTGNAPLVITSATASCGCTVPSWPKEPIAAGESGVIEVKFDSEGKSGIQNKTVSIVANTIPNTTVLYLRGEIVKAQ